MSLFSRNFKMPLKPIKKSNEISWLTLLWGGKIDFQSSLQLKIDRQLRCRKGKQEGLGYEC
jgi:hypothetical protein